MSALEDAPLSENASFEELLDRLEEAVSRLERPDLGLDEALRVYEEGVRILRLCYERLSSAQGRVEMLLEEADGVLRKVRFEPDSGDGPRREAAGRAGEIAGGEEEGEGE